MNVLFALATGAMFAMGVFQILRRDLIKVAMGFYILFTAINFSIFCSRLSTSCCWPSALLRVNMRLTSILPTRSKAGNRAIPWCRRSS